MTRCGFAKAKRNPINIDLLSIGNPCNQNCKQCFYSEDYSAKIIKNELDLADKIIKTYSKSSFFIYPKEITTSLHLLPLFQKVGQKGVSSNGLIFSEKTVEALKNYQINRIRFTLFATPEEQQFFNGNTLEDYEAIKNSARICAENGMEVTISNVISRTSMKSIEKLALLSRELGAKKLELIRLKPLGNGASMDLSELINESDMDQIIFSAENAKQKAGDSLYILFNLGFGPNFYKKSISDAKKKVSKARNSWVKGKYLCPIIDNNYYGISMKSGKVYWCFNNVGNPETAIGYIDQTDAKLKLTDPIDFSRETLEKKLRGNCAYDNCQYQKICLGGCRNAAYIFAKLRNEPEPEYAGMDICLTKSYERIFGK